MKQMLIYCDTARAYEEMKEILKIRAKERRAARRAEREQRRALMIRWLLTGSEVLFLGSVALYITLALLH